MGGFGEVLSRYENSVSLDPQVTDTWGVPVLRFNYRFGDNERKMAADMAEAAREMFDAAGFEIVEVSRDVLTEGWSIHELGTARMGSDLEDVGAQSLPAGARRLEPLRRRRQQPRQRVVREPDVDHHGAGLAVVRVPGRAIAKGRAVMADAPNLTRRAVLKAGAVVAATTVTATRLSAFTLPADGPRALTRDQYAMLDELTEILIPADEHSGGARAAGVAAYIDSTLADEFDATIEGVVRVGPGSGGRPGPAASRSRRFMALSPAEREAIVSTMAEGEAESEDRRGALLRGAEAADRARLLHLAPRHSRRDELQGQHDAGGVLGHRRQPATMRSCRH